MLANEVYPEFRNGQLKWLGSEVLSGINDFSTVWYVDGDVTTSGTGKTPNTAFKTIQEAITAASANDTIYVRARHMAAAATDPVSYDESVIVPAGKDRLSIIGYGNRTQGGLPQLKQSASTASALLTVRSPGCLIAGLGINGVNSTVGGILLDDDGGTAKTAFGTTITGCHFKNCVGSTATDSTTGGAVFVRNAWQCLIKNNVFYKNAGGIVVTSPYSPVQDLVIEDNVFLGTATTTDSYIYTNGALLGLVIRRNVFASVLPALSSGAVVRYVDLTGTLNGIFTENYFSGVYTTAGFGAAKAAAKIPVLVGMPHNYSDSGLIVREA